MNVSAVIVTRGDVDLAPVIDSLPREWEKVVWDNSKRDHDFAVYGRYYAVDECEHDLIYVQDDDCILDAGGPEAIAAQWQPGHVVCNMPQRFRDTGFYDEHALVGFGAIFDRDLPRRAFQTFGYQEYVAPLGDEIWGRSTAAGVTFPDRAFVYRTCDVVFTALTPRTLVDLPYTDREFASAPNRMWKQPDHVGERTRMLELALKARDA